MQDIERIVYIFAGSAFQRNKLNVIDWKETKRLTQGIGSLNVASRSLDPYVLH